MSAPPAACTEHGTFGRSTILPIASDNREAFV
jgi:hypothetical protein